MTELLVVGVIALMVIAAAAVYGPRLGVAAPLLLVVVGIVASLVPIVPDFTIEPEWILEGVLPPLLYSSAVSMPSMNFRREFAAISGLSVLLVVGSALVLGLFFAIVIPGLGFAWGAALGAIISPTDAVATSIVKGTSTSRRVVSILDGESLLNDATALVLLRTATLAAAASFSFFGALGSFAYSVAVAVVIGLAAGLLGLLVRHRIKDPTITTVISFTIPFLASVPTELFQASGLVAAVVAGLVTGFRAPRLLSPQARLSDSQNWRTVEVVLEGAVFLTMGLQLSSIIAGVQSDHAGVWTAVLIAVGALVLTVAVRAAFVAPLLWLLSRRRHSREEWKGRVETMQRDPGEQMQKFRSDKRRRTPTPQDVARFTTRITRLLADMEYYLKAPLGPRDGVALVWAGMRGAVTVAAAQTLQEDSPSHSLLVFVAFAVAALSLLLQGGTIGPLLRWISPPATTGEDPSITEDRARAMQLMQNANDATPAADYASEKEHRMAILHAQRNALLDARDDGTFDADMMDHMLTTIDAQEITLDLRGGPAG